MIKIVSGWSNPGGSTTAFINLTNALNGAGIETTFCGPHDWHLDKCKSEQTSGRLKITKEDHLIIHFINKFKFRPAVKKFILSSHEQDIFPVKNLDYKVFDKIHYVSQHQKKYHGVQHPNFLLPNILDDLKANSKPEAVAGIIGSVDKNKQTHISIQNAVNDGFKTILLYGNITDMLYWVNEVKPIVDKHRANGIDIQGPLYENDKQKLYDSISDVYHSSLMETWGYIKGECKLTNTNYHGNKSTDGYWEMSKDDIVERWVKELEI